MRDPASEKELTTLEKVLVTRLDVQDTASITSAVEEGIAGFGTMDVLVDKAG